MGPGEVGATDGLWGYCKFLLNLFEEEIVKDMRKGTVTQVMAKTRHRDIEDVCLSDFKVWLKLFDSVHQLLRKISSTYTTFKISNDKSGLTDAVLESVVDSSGEHVLNTAELLEVPKSLEFLSVDNIPTKNMVRYI